MAGADDFTPVGYKACRDCGDLMLETVKAPRCDRCRDIAVQVATDLELAASNGQVLRTRRPSRRRRTTRSAAGQERRRLWGQARQAALLRLARIHRPLYEVLLAEEKAKRGLDPALDERPPLRQVG